MYPTRYPCVKALFRRKGGRMFNQPEVSIWAKLLNAIILLGVQHVMALRDINENLKGLREALERHERKH